MKKQTTLNIDGTGAGFLIIPLMVQRDRRLTDGAKILYGEIKRLEFKFEGAVSVTEGQLAIELNKTERQIRNLMKQLVNAGWIQKEKVSFAGANQYTIISPEEVIQRELAAFLSVSKVFAGLKLQDVLTKYNGVKLLRTLELLEYSYKTSNRKVENPLALVKKAMRSGASADEGFTPGWWKERIKAIKAEAEKRKAKKEAEDRAKAKHDEMTRYLEGLPESEYKDLRERAIEYLEGNGGMPRFGREIFIKNKMYDLAMEDKHGS